MTGSSRVVLPKVTPDNYAAMRKLKDTVVAGATKAGIEPLLIDLVNMRASQINGCTLCLDMHSKEARAKGETEQRLYVLSAWREAPFFTQRERVALELTEAITLVHDGQVADDVYDLAAKEFSEDELSQLIWVIIVMNNLNRVAITTRMQPAKD
ncbi:carboxymuconolactone decarboxylase family protein [Saccharopolyspora taberi]|uniref:Carboxymuconolactone decarboxylase family protein n=1 Tax=Saccharopolyspora taberi TaxID=60895 RepID=A0ABN3V6I9_9PSEU